jgi:benzoylformate decarboxylase/acetolactate synthase-1/2/3 large subunit
MVDQPLDYGSDVVAAILRRLDIRFASLNPGASFRGIHESLVATGGPEPITCLFEGTNVAIAHGYAKSAGEPMAVLVHNLVGLQHASMGLFNAFSDGVPMVVVGGSGPADHTRRRPWIDWVHTPSMQSLVVRPFVKWDSQPVSIDELPETFTRAYQLATSGIPGPTYVAVDAIIQEERITAAPSLEGVVPRTSPPLTVSDGVLAEFAGALAGAELPLILVDHSGRSEAGYEATIAIAEHLAAPVVDLGGRHSFPNTHWADATFDRVELLRRADVVFCVDPRDTRWATTTINQENRGWNDLMRPDARLLVLSMNELANRSFIEREPVVPTHDHATADSEVALARLAELVCAGPRGPEERRRWLEGHSQELRRKTGALDTASDHLTEGEGVAAVHDAIKDGPWQLAFAGFRPWVRRTWKLDRWNAHLGGSGGAGLGYGPGAAVGAGLAHRNDDTLVVTIQPDGDMLYDPTALWTAAHHRIPLLMVVIDNGTYGADRIHQARMATWREGRSAAEAHIGVDFDDPAIDIAGLAGVQGVQAWTVETREDLAQIRRAAAYVRDEGLPAVVALKTPKPAASGLG